MHKTTVCKVFKIFQCGKYLVAYVLKETKSVTMNIFRKICKSRIKLCFHSSTAENCTEK